MICRQRYELDDDSVVNEALLRYEDRLSADQAGRRACQRNFHVGGVAGPQKWSQHISQAESRKTRHVCRLFVASKSKYPLFSSSRRVFRLGRTDIA